MQKKRTDRMKRSLEYKKVMYLVELWVFLKTQHDKHRYSSWRLIQIQRRFPHVKSNVNEVEIITGL